MSNALVKESDVVRVGDSHGDVARILPRRYLPINHLDSVLDEAFAKNLPRYPLLPATFLGRLAVDNSQKGKRFGELILVDALKKSLDATTQVASVAVIAEALDEEALSFYIKYGFQQFRQEPMKLYLPMKSVEELCQLLGT